MPSTMELAFGAALAVWAVAGRAEGGVDGSAARGVTGLGGRVRRRSDTGESVGLGVTFANAVDDDVDLIVGEHATSAFGEGGHGGARDAVGDDFAESGIVGDGEIDRITERKSRATSGFGAVTARTIFLIEEGEVGDVVGVDGDGRFGGTAGKIRAAGAREESWHRGAARSGRRTIMGEGPRVCVRAWCREFRCRRGRRRG